MKPKTLVIAVTFFLVANCTIAHCFSSMIFYDLEHSSQQDQLTEKEKENKKRNQEAIDELNAFIKNLEKDNKTDKAEALKAMRDHIKKNRTKDPGTVIDEAADEGKKTANLKDNKKEIREYVDTIHSTVIKKIFNLIISARGTGRTTGHIADLSVTNNSDQFVSLTPQLLYIPGRDKYQGYIIYIPEPITVAPGTSTTLPIPGYCANPHVPPVPLNEPMPSPSEWIPIQIIPSGGFEIDGHPPTVPEPMNPPGGSTGPPQHTTPIRISDQVPVPGYDPSMTNTVQASPGYSEDKGSDSDIKVTYPGTQVEIEGSIDPDIDPTIFGQLAATGLTAIIDNVDTIQNSGIYITPFSNDKEKEKETIIQQTFWIYVAVILGKDYDKEDFANNVYKQFENATGKTVTSLPPEQKEQVDGGVDDFWTVYTAVGIEAKVFSQEESPTIHNSKR
ncbi:MAG: hypothetical protein P1U56_07720 [Saprospiraceae bacterium]|nr:hypothetical protein [Saprospiraceae bacterium]